MEVDRYTDLDNQAVLDEANYVGEDEIYLTSPTDNESKGKKKGLIAVGAAILVFLSKAKGILFLVLSKFKFLFVLLKLSKFGTTAISMALMIWVYAVTYGIWYAIGFVALIFVHEIGHYLTAKKIGLAVTAPVFIPFVGALIGLKEQPRDAITEATVGYGGPFLGSIAAAAGLVFFWLTGSGLALALAYTGFMLNLFNLLPVHPLDGGRIVTAISPYLWLVGIPILIYLLFTSFNPILLLITILGVVQAYKLWKNKDNGYYALPVKTKALFATLYFGLVSLLVIGMWYALNMFHSMR